MIRFLDLNQQYLRLQQGIEARWQRIFQHAQFIMGPEVVDLESELARYVGVKHCVTTTSGTLALQIALMALGVGPGDEVITTPFSFFATAGTIVLLGATPVFVDIDPRTYNLDPTQVATAITPKTKAIMPVSLFGQCADLTAINAIANQMGLPVIEDAAQSFGAKHRGKLSCGLSTIGCTSFFPSKPLGCYGDGGACFTDDDFLAEKMRLLRNHGQAARYQHVCIGTNARLDTLQAAVLLEKLTIFPEEMEKRQLVASWYQHYLQNQIGVPFVASENTSVFAQYTIEMDYRDVVCRAMADVEIPTAIHYSLPLHKQAALLPVINSLSCFPNAERASTRVLSLPFHPYMEEAQVRSISTALLRLEELSCLQVAGNKI